VVQLRDLRPEGGGSDEDIAPQPLETQCALNKILGAQRLFAESSEERG
jgi:hypothetical protein